MPFEPAHQADVRSQMGRDLRRTAQKTVFDARQRLTSSSGTRASFDFELIDEYADSRISSALVLPVMFAILALFSSLWVQPFAAAGWAGLVAAANVGVVIASRRFKRTSPDLFIASRWTATFITVETIYGIAWSLLATFTLFGKDSASLSVVMFALALVGIAANAVSTRTLPGATLMSTLPVALTVAINLIFLGGTLNWSLAALTLGAEIFFGRGAAPRRAGQYRQVAVPCHDES
jgi:two-component system cell cycle sensor histidine kinase PleC